MIGSKAAAKGLELIFNVDPRLDMTLVGDPLRLSQIFVNYVTNAVKFTDDGEIELIVELREDTADEVLLYGAVRDTGIGLSEAQRARLFHPFEQADTSITRRYGGAGLGLAICKRLAEAMCGAVVAGMLAGRGVAAATAEGGRAALDAVAVAAAAGEPYALVLLDAEMADLDGFETAAEINALGLDPAPRMILTISAWG